MSKRTCTSLIITIAAGLLVVACGSAGQEQSVKSVQQALELEDGGYDMSDELPVFGLADLDQAPVDPTGLSEVPEELDLEQYTGTQTIAGGQQPAILCAHGFIKGVWKPLKAGKPFGRFQGKWVRADGQVEGHLRGVYGKNLAGHQIFFGKYIGAKGRARGLIKGRFGDGFFRGRWHGAHGLAGRLVGVYERGVFKARWRSFCARCRPVCKPGFKHLPGTCYCVPAAVVPCHKGQCPGGMHCDPCPLPPACKLPGVKCPAVCGPPVCKKNPPPLS